MRRAEAEGGRKLAQALSAVDQPLARHGFVVGFLAPFPASGYPGPPAPRGRSVRRWGEAGFRAYPCVVFATSADASHWSAAPGTRRNTGDASPRVGTREFFAAAFSASTSPPLKRGPFDGPFLTQRCPAPVVSVTICAYLLGNPHKIKLKHQSTRVSRSAAAMK